MNSTIFGILMYFMFAGLSFGQSPAYPSRGSDSATVVIEEFVDFQCPFCARSTQTMARILTEYTGKVRLVYRAFPLEFHSRALPAAVAGACAHRQYIFWSLYDLMFSNQKSLTDENFETWVVLSGGNLETFKACIQSKEGLSDVTADIDEANARGVNGTPTFFINGRLVSGALSFEEFKVLIEEALAQ